ncbi:hypothetical protein EJ06DRAFT_495034 [Trichodelitschia bisporula]|uniref:U3 small nucleolar RNA-associated protein 6 N-terminal domain-containing protein n=1 Tax=Trichodelitschia bisporula TaxID=703511 RepID=A0A6G1HW40_9PEZI|nr:hypothetical protein EJ06DRAFT_495034 [Trichodelitschia bisporula]
MAGASDKARFYLEQSVPELQELLRKKIFTKDEVSSIAKKRSDFEHTLNARGSQPGDYARYAEYEMNLEALRKKRVQRLGIKTGGHAGQRRIFFILDRGTRKFPGDLRLWMQCIEFARKEKANKKLGEIMAAMLRLHPTKPDLWLYAAQYSLDAQADMTAARSYMQRGLRFCAGQRLMWLEYAKLEMVYVAKVAARRRILGLDETRKEVVETEDMLALPDVTAEDINPSLKDGVDDDALEKLAATPALTGAIPIAVFDEAMKKFHNDATLAEQFFDIIAEFDQTPATPTILQHILDHLRNKQPESPSTTACEFSLPLVGVEPTSAQFPAALGDCLHAIRAGKRHKVEVAEKALMRLLPFALLDLDADIQTVISATLVQQAKAIPADRLEKLSTTLQKKRTKEAEHLAKLLS